MTGCHVLPRRPGKGYSTSLFWLTFTMFALWVTFCMTVRPSPRKPVTLRNGSKSKPFTL
jgi:hypothetical protein